MSSTDSLASPSLASSLSLPTVNRSKAVGAATQPGFFASCGKGALGWAGRNKWSIAMNGALLATTLMFPPAGLLGVGVTALATGMGVRLGASFLARTVASRTLGKAALRIGGRFGARSLGTMLRNAPGMIAGMCNNLAKQVKGIAKGLAAVAGTLTGILSQGGGMSNVMSGGDAASPQAGKDGPAPGETEPADAPLPAQQYAAAAAPVPATAAAAPAATHARTAAPSGPDI